ncbi:hypothetical protein HZ993_06965 [Rhodoferax sp. AJA081-3]|uniref:glycine-rich domain-containing protein n=1 Tax=Rhodoferax sp. AJA081-3 TaxID=2752316 RepID=UPI001ADEEE46|nr:hypothetical protein [Rhodoferax sp. AJA081-3]QTN29552.1 hypothetical protein HZ993_06965 [Rhodoferax sp. AJA081-3]
MTFATSPDTEQARRLFDKISMFDFAKVTARYAKDGNVPLESAAETLLELKRWFTLCALHPEKTYATGGQVDAMWHTFILFTKDYARFCQEIAGTFIHHSPETGGGGIEEQIASAENMREKLRLLEADYLKYFGAPPPSHIWPRSPEPNSFPNAFAFLEAMAR